MSYPSLSLHNLSYRNYLSRLCALTLVLLMALTVIPCAYADGETHISSAEELVLLAQEPTGRFVLDCDLDMAGVDWAPIPFGGCFDGAGHTLFNLTVTQVSQGIGTTYDGNMNAYPETHFAGLFSDASGAEIKNLRLLGAKIDVTTDRDCFCGLLCGCGIGTVIENCTLDGKVRLYASGTNEGVAGVVGFGDADISSCTVSAELLFADRSTGAVKCEQYMGGLLACGVCNVSGNDVSLDGYISCNGYVHSGGLIGMMYRMRFEYVPKIIDGNSVTGRITFYENNIDRRAYCDGVIGEDLFHWIPPTNNDVSGFERSEVFTYDTELTPETCERPDCTDLCVEATCTDYGYTIHTCALCGYSYADSYVLPHHTPCEEWTVSLEPTYDVCGEKQLLCRGCGIVLKTEEIPALIPCSSCTLSASELTMKYGEIAFLTADVLPEDAAVKELIWSSDDENTVSVDRDGRLTAKDEGTAVITCESFDGFACAQCRVTVTMSLWQRLLRLIGIL